MLQAVCVWWVFLEGGRGRGWEKGGEKIKKIPCRSTCPHQAICTFQCLCTLQRKPVKVHSNNARSGREKKRHKELFSELMRKFGVKWMQPSLKLHWVLLATSRCYRDIPTETSSTEFSYCYTLLQQKDTRRITLGNRSKSNQLEHQKIFLSFMSLYLGKVKRIKKAEQHPQLEDIFGLHCSYGFFFF